MSKLGLFVDRAPTRLREILAQCAQAGSPVALIAALDLDIMPDVLHDSPSTIVVFRTAQLGADNGAMYAGTPEEGHLAGHAWVKSLAPIWDLNPANIHAIDNESGRNDLDGLRWYTAYAMGCMDQAQEYGLSIAIGNWSKGMPPNDPASIAVMLPMFRQAAQYGHCVAVHEYATSQPMINDSACLRFEKLYDALPADARPMLAITEASPDMVFPCTGAEYVREIGPYDLALMNSPYRDKILGAALFRYGSSGESSLISIGPDIAKWIAEHPTPPAPPVDDRIETLEHRVEAIEAQAFTLNDALIQEGDDRKDDSAALLSMIDALDRRVKKLEGATPPPPPPPPPDHIVPIGLDMRADGEDHNAPYFKLELQCLSVAHIQAVKIQSNSTFESFDAFVTAGAIPECSVLRLYAAGDNPSLSNPAQFYSEQRMWIDRFYRKGGRHVEIHNEPNLAAEGLGRWWADAAGFSSFFSNVSSLISAMYPAISIGFPGLSPQPNVIDWLPAIQILLNLGAADWIGVHSYWQHGGNEAGGIDNFNDGRYYRRFLSLKRGDNPAPLIITEFANVATADSDAAKGAQYKAYYGSLEAQIVGAFAFCSSATSKVFNDSRQTWIRGGAVTDIARAVAG